MAIYVYNTKQQALNSAKLAELFAFTSNDFAGLISNSVDPIVADTTGDIKTWHWNSTLINTQAALIGGGVDIAYDVPEESFQFANECSVWGLEIGLPDPNLSIASDVNTRAEVTEVPCTSIGKDNLYFIVNSPSGSPKNKNYYEYGENGYVKSDDNAVVEGKEYYYQLENEVFVIIGAAFANAGQPKTFEYYGNTCWITNDRFFIPFCGLCNGEVIPMLFNRDKTGYESFLTARTYYHLLQELGNQFVWRVGGPTLGDVGDLNITDNYITNKENAEEGVKIDRPILTNVATSGTSQSTYMADYMLIVDENGVLREAVDYRIPVTHGGTGAINQGGARLNLGFSSGTDNPTNPPTPRPDGSVDKGAVYFKILT